MYNKTKFFSFILLFLFLGLLYFSFENNEKQPILKESIVKVIEEKVKDSMLVTAKNYRSIHVFVALCDNINQGIVPVSKKIGNGKDAKNNLYWGALYGVKTHFIRSKEWIYLKAIPTDNPIILERILFKHKSKNVYLLADAYDGAQIQICISDFLKAANEQFSVRIDYTSKTLYFGGNSDLLAYVGHDGLMEFDVEVSYKKSVKQTRDVMMLACYSQEYFAPEIKQAKANPLLWTTHLMAPEAYTLKAAIEGWVLNETGNQIEERAAQSYNKYQKCGIRGARNLLTSGFE